MKPTVTQLYNATISLLSGALADPNMAWPITDKHIEQFIDIAMRTAELIPETDLLPEPDALRKFLAEVFAEVNGRPIAKSQLSMLLQDRLKMGKRNAEHTLMWAESNKLLNADVNGNGVRYTLA